MGQGKIQDLNAEIFKLKKNAQNLNNCQNIAKHDFFFWTG